MKLQISPKAIEWLLRHLEWFKDATKVGGDGEEYNLCDSEDKPFVDEILAAIKKSQLWGYEIKIERR